LTDSVLQKFIPPVIRDAFREMLNSVTENGHQFDDCKRILRESEYDCLPFRECLTNHSKTSNWIRGLKSSMPGAKPMISLSSSFQGVQTP
jgi:hypothetical protein